jgi:hypothetical protein
MQLVSATIQTGDQAAEVKYRLLSVPLYLVEKATDVVREPRRRKLPDVRPQCAKGYWKGGTRTQREPDTLHRISENDL